VSCPSCNKASWAGCGAHVERVLAGVPAEERCRCPSAGRGQSEGWGAVLLGLVVMVLVGLLMHWLR
jgi:hypothetical protein